MTIKATVTFPDANWHETLRRTLADLLDGSRHLAITHQPGRGVVTILQNVLTGSNAHFVDASMIRFSDPGWALSDVDFTAASGFLVLEDSHPDSGLLWALITNLVDDDDQAGSNRLPDGWTLVVASPTLPRDSSINSIDARLRALKAEFNHLCTT